MENKRYYWLRLKNDFFDETYVKALRKLPQGDSLVICFLKMQLRSLKDEGVIQRDHILPDANDELALALGEDENIVKLCVEALIRYGLVERLDDESLYLTRVKELIGSEAYSTERMRNLRARRRASLCDGNVTECDDGVTRCDDGVTRCDDGVTRCDDGVTRCDEELEKENRVREENNNPPIIPPKAIRNRIPPSVEDVRAYCEERNNKVDAQAFVDFYTAKGWLIGKNPMKDWQAAVRTWEKDRRNSGGARQPENDPTEGGKWCVDTNTYDWGEEVRTVVE